MRKYHKYRYKKRRKSRILIYIIILLILALWALRSINPREIDDVSPSIPCTELQRYNLDILWVIPNFNNISIVQDKAWCKQTLSLNKTLGMHGVYHTYEEFNTDKDQAYLKQGINAFESCFGFKPKIFKPPQLKISSNNKELIRSNNLTIKDNFNQITHKVYHCNDSGKYKNWFINLF